MAKRDRFNIIAKNGDFGDARFCHLCFVWFYAAADWLLTMSDNVSCLVDSHYLYSTLQFTSPGPIVLDSTDRATV